MAKEECNYWDDYNNLQRVKHEIIKNYLNGWLPKLTQGRHAAPRVIYLDTHAGRGKHASGQLGSPLVALQTIVNHKVSANAEIRLFFIEENAENIAALQRELAAFGQPPKNIIPKAVEGECFSLLDDLIKQLKDAKMEIAPSFIFCDPFGFTVPFPTLATFMKFQRVELFVNVIWRELDMAIAHGRKGVAGHVKNLDYIFGGQTWRNINSPDFNERAEQCVQELRRLVGAQWATYIRMAGKNGATRYFLLHLSNHIAGRMLMKECMWKSCPQEGYFARITDNPAQQFLLTPEADLRDLEVWVIERLKSRPRYWQELLDLIPPEIWLEKHLNEVIRGLRKEDIIRGSQHDGKVFAPTNNPLLSLVST